MWYFQHMINVRFFLLFKRFVFWSFVNFLASCLCQLLAYHSPHNHAVTHWFTLFSHFTCTQIIWSKVFLLQTLLYLFLWLHNVWHYRTQTLTKWLNCCHLASHLFIHWLLVYVMWRWLIACLCHVTLVDCLSMSCDAGWLLVYVMWRWLIACLCHVMWRWFIGAKPLLRYTIYPSVMKQCHKINVVIPRPICL